MSEGTEAMQKYFSQLKGGGNKNAIQERRTIAIDDNAALVTGFTNLLGCRRARPYQRHYDADHQAGR